MFDYIVIGIVSIIGILFITGVLKIRITMDRNEDE